MEDPGKSEANSALENFLMTGNSKADLVYVFVLHDEFIKTESIAEAA